MSEIEETIRDSHVSAQVLGCGSVFSVLSPRPRSATTIDTLGSRSRKSTEALFHPPGARGFCETGEAVLSLDGSRSGSPHAHLRAFAEILHDPWLDHGPSRQAHEFGGPRPASRLPAAGPRPGGGPFATSSSSCEDSFLQKEVVLESDPHMSAQEDRHRRHRELHARHPRDDVGRGRRELVAHVKEVVRRGGTPPSRPSRAESAPVPHEAHFDSFLPCWMNPTSKASISGLMCSRASSSRGTGTVSRVHVHDGGGATPKFRVPVVRLPSRFRFRGAARSASVVPAIPLVEVITINSFASDLVHGLLEESKREVGRSFSSRQWT